MSESLSNTPEQFDVSEVVRSTVETVRELTERERALSRALMALTDDQRESFVTELGRQKAEQEPSAEDGQKMPDPFDSNEAFDLTLHKVLMTYGYNRGGLNDMFYRSYHEGMGWTSKTGE